MVKQSAPTGRTRGRVSARAGGPAAFVERRPWRGPTNFKDSNAPRAPCSSILCSVRCLLCHAPGWVATIPPTHPAPNPELSVVFHEERLTEESIIGVRGINCGRGEDQTIWVNIM